VRSHSHLSRLGLALAAAVLGLTAGATGAAADPEDAPGAVSTVYDLDMTATFDKPSYGTGEKMTITVTVTNNGTGPVVTRADFFRQQPDLIRVDLVNPFERWEPFTLAAGTSVTHTLTGSMPNPDITVGTLYGMVADETGAARPFLFTVPIEQTLGHASGVVYYDRNRNRQFDEGEGQRGVALTWALQLQQERIWKVTTDANGVFRLANLPTGAYAVTGEGQSLLQVGYTPVTVTESGMDGLLLRGTAPIAGLVPKIEFTKDSYATDEAPVVRVTLTNTSEHALSGIVATCDRAGMETSLDGTGEGWGDLARDGVDIAPRSTIVLEVTEPMPDGSPGLGLVNVGCEFRFPDVESQYNPSSFDRAAVPGARGDLTGDVTVSHGDVGVAGIRMVLVPDLEHMPAPCAIVAETTTDANGTFTFHEVPVGIYMVYLFPPPGWRVEYDNPTRTDVRGGYTSQMLISVVPGEAPPPALPACATGGGSLPTTPATPVASTTSTTPATTARPAPQGGRVPTLAHTGASIAVPGVTGLLALLAGAGLVLVSRRRTTN
jgi:hypothetical protein